MGDPQWRYRPLTGYGPYDLRCGTQTGFRMVFASFLSLLLLLMIVFFVFSCDVGFLSACFAPIGPCVAFVEGHVLSDSLASRKAGSAAPFRVALPVVLRNSSSRRDRSPLRSAIVALRFMERPTKSLLYRGRASPTPGSCLG